MTYLAVSLACACIYLAWQRHRIENQLERERHAHKEERRELYQRIQAPEVAPYLLQEPDDSPNYKTEGEDFRKALEEAGA